MCGEASGTVVDPDSFRLIVPIGNNRIEIAIAVKVA